MNERMVSMLVEATAKIKKSQRQEIVTDNMQESVTIWTVSYEIRSDEIDGVIDANHLIYQLDEEVRPELIRGFSRFSGRILDQSGSFIAQEDGRSQDKLLKINGRIIDAYDDFSLLVGRYYYNGFVNESVFEIQFDIEL
ncbi:hypothetical protein ACF3NG_08920 [Aerococcaceae bacterium WGS1372]